MKLSTMDYSAPDDNTNAQSSDDWRAKQQAANRAEESEALKRMSLQARQGSKDMSSSARLLSSNLFQGTMALLILLNALVIGLETDYPDTSIQKICIWPMLEHTFLLVFILELALKISILGFYNTFTAPDYLWNVLDVVVVVVGITDACLSVVHIGSDTVAFMLRTIRMLRILRIMKLIRFLKQLYVLAVGFGLAVVAVFWVTVLVSFGLYVCSIVLVRTLGRMKEAPSDHTEFLEARFGTIPLSMLTLFNLMLSPNLEEYHAVLFDFPAFAIFVIGFTVFGSLGLIAVMTSVIMESMFEKNDIKLEDERALLERNRRAITMRCGEMFDALPKNADGSSARVDDLRLILPELAKLLKAQSVIFSPMDLDRMLELVHENGKVVLSDFVYMVRHIVEGVRPMLIMDLIHAVADNRQVVEAMFEVLLSKVDALQADSLSWQERFDEIVAAAQAPLPPRELDAKERPGTRSVSQPAVDAIGAPIEAGNTGGMQSTPSTVAAPASKDPAPEALEQWCKAHLSEMFCANAQLLENIRILGNQIGALDTSMMTSHRRSTPTAGCTSERIMARGFSSDSSEAVRLVDGCRRQRAWTERAQLGGEMTLDVQPDREELTALLTGAGQRGTRPWSSRVRSYRSASTRSDPEARSFTPSTCGPATATTATPTRASSRTPAVAHP